MRYLVIDERMRSIEKETLKGLGYELIEIKKSEKVYPEISEVKAGMSSSFILTVVSW